LLMIPVTISLFYLPIYQIWQRTKEAKLMELIQIQNAICGNHAVLAISRISHDADRYGLHELLTWRHEVKNIPTLPVNFGIFAEIGAHACAALMLSGGAWIFTTLKVPVPH
jgi:hypothetical protein